MNIFKYIYKVILVTTLSMFLTINSFANVIQDHPKKLIDALFIKLSDQKLDTSTIIELVEQTDLKKGSDLKKWVDKNPIPGFELKFFMENDLIATKVNQDVVYFDLLEGNKIKIILKDKKSIIDSSMSFDEIAKKINKDFGFNTERKSSFFNFFIEDAHAFVGLPVLLTVAFIVLLGALALMAGRSVIGGHKVNDVERLVNNLCSQLQSTPIENLDMKKLTGQYNEISEYYLKVCMISMLEIQSEYLCTSIKETKDCIKEKVSQLNGVNSSERSNIKKIEYDSEKDRYLQNAGK